LGQLDGKIAVVTGAGSGIGLAIAERFGAEGAEVVLVGRQKERLDEAAARIGGGAHGVSVDVGEEEQVRQLMEDLPRVDILCTMAGKAVFGPIDELPPSAWKDLFHARFFGQIYAIHYAVPKMPEGGVILLCSGIADAAYVPDYAGGAAIGGAVNAMAKNLAVELAPRSIRVNALSPGFIIGTDIKFNLEGDKAIDFVKRSIAETPLPYHGEPKDLADAAMFLATCKFVTGQVVEVDGGWTAT
jgi:NAD(P)-dependent dehydrogenase (short-subunit alcohol dehydrogenase family)